MVKLQAPEDCADTLFWDGVIYQADKDRVFTVPEAAEAMLCKFGFKRIPEKVKRK